MSINLFNIPLLEETDEGEAVCVICQEGLGTSLSYKLPECQHEYHVHCIVTWFRHRPSTEHYPSDGACPLCGNKGINHVDKKSKNWRACRYTGKGWDLRLRQVMNEGKKTDTPIQLKRAMNNYNKAQEVLKEKNSELIEFKKGIKNSPGIYSDTQKEYRKFREALWRAKAKLTQTREVLVNFPIVPIIIPLPVDIN